MKTRLLRNSKLAGGFGLLLALILTVSLALPAMADNPPGVVKYKGDVSVCGIPMPEGTVVDSTVNGVPGPSTTVDGSGRYGYLVSFKLQGPIGDPIQLIVEGQVLYEDVIPELATKVVDLLVRPTLTTASTAGGSVTTPGEPGPYGPYDCGTPVNIVASPAGGYVFVNWTGDNGTIANPVASATTITMNGIYAIMANFVLEVPVDTCDLTTDSSEGGSVTTPGEGDPVETYPCGTEDVPIVATPDDCYEFVNWTGETGTIFDVDSASTTIDMDDDYSIYANFTLKTVGLSTDSSEGGSVTTPGEGDPVETYPCGTEDVPIVATPDELYDFSHWSGETGTIFDVGSASTTIDMDDDYSIYANFIPEDVEYCALSTDSSEGGSVTTPGEGDPVETYVCGTEDVPIVATPDDCYEFVNWTGETGTIFDVDSASTTIDMDDDYFIHANFVLKQFYLTTDSTEGGSVTTPGEGINGPYDCGEVVAIVATATGCYNFVEWTGDTEFIAEPEDASTTITMNGHYTIEAVFALAEELEDIEIPFNVGWNTFSTPISLHDCVDTWEEFIAANDLVIEMIYGYNAAAEAWEPVNGADEIEPLYGFYVKVVEAGTAHIIPNSHETPLPIRDLIAGVHLIGIAPASLGDELLTTVLFSLYMAEGPYIGYEMVVSPNVNSPDDWAYTRDVGESPTMKCGRAYWLVMANADKYVGSTNTPLVP